MRQQVVLWKCKEYDTDLIKVILKKSFDEIGGLQRFVQPGQTVFLKLNLLMKKRPEEAVTTHPALVEAVAVMLKEQGARVIVGDSPGGPYTKSALRVVYRSAGIEEAVRRAGVELNYDTETVEASFPEGRITKRFTLLKPLVDADVYISLSKLKTHMMTKFTGAVKVNFGAIPGLVKAEYHFKMPQVMDFSNMLLDLATYVNPALNIMDAVVGMEGKGPSAGEARDVGALLVSTNAPALDVVAAALVGIRPDSIPTIRAARDRGLPSGVEDVDIIGYSLKDFKIKPFITPKTTSEARFPIPDLMNRYLEKWLKPIPVFVDEQCIMCQECVKHCPPQALKAGKKVPELDKGKCISCFCCQELCPKKAVDVKRSPLSSLLFK